MEDKVVFITGAASGIGQATAVLFAENGAKLILTDKNDMGGTVKQCEKTGLKTNKILCYIADLLIPEDIDGMVEAAIGCFNQVDVLVNNGGVNMKSKIHTHPMETLDNMYKLIFRAPYYLCKKLLPSLIETKGNIVNITSVSGLAPDSFCTNYSCMKAALAHLTKILALDFGPKGVRVNAIAPGTVMTNIGYAGGFAKTEEELKEIYEEYSRIYPLKRYGYSSDVAELVYFLASDRGSFITGVEIPCDGGHMLMGGRT